MEWAAWLQGFGTIGAFVVAMGVWIYEISERRAMNLREQAANVAAWTGPEQTSVHLNNQLALPVYQVWICFHVTARRFEIGADPQNYHSHLDMLAPISAHEPPVVIQLASGFAVERILDFRFIDSAGVGWSRDASGRLKRNRSHEQSLLDEFKNSVPFSVHLAQHPMRPTAGGDRVPRPATRRRVSPDDRL